MLCNANVAPMARMNPERFMGPHPGFYVGQIGIIEGVPDLTWSIPIPRSVLFSLATGDHPVRQSNLWIIPSCLMHLL